MLFNTNNSIQYYSFIYTQLNSSKNCYVSLTIQLYIHLFTQLNARKALILTIQFNMLFV